MLQEISFIDQHHNFKHNFFPLAHVYTISIHMSKKQQMYINVIKRTMLIDKHYSGETNAEDKGVYNINRTQTIAVWDKKQVSQFKVKGQNSIILQVCCGLLVQCWCYLCVLIKVNGKNNSNCSETTMSVHKSLKWPI